MYDENAQTEFDDFRNCLAKVFYIEKTTFETLESNEVDTIMDSSDDNSAISDDYSNQFSSIDDSFDGSDDYDYGSIDDDDYEDDDYDDIE